MNIIHFPPRRFDVALSFPGEHREYVEEVAALLATAVGAERVLYDKYHEAEFARPDLDLYLPSLYHLDSNLIVIFLCDAYKDKRWCRLEWRHIRQLISTEDAQRIMFLRFGNGSFVDIGITSGDGTIDFMNRPPGEIAAKILERLSINQQSTSVRQSEGEGCAVEVASISPQAPPDLVGRDNERRSLWEQWEAALEGKAHRARVLTIVSLGGEGKTSLIAKWAAELAQGDWSGCDAAYAWSFHSQGSREQMTASSDAFLREALNFFGDASMAAGPQPARVKGTRLAQLVGARRALLFLDGLEPLQYPPVSPWAGRIKDEGVAALLKGLAAVNRGLCVVTTRIAILDLQGWKDTTAPQEQLGALQEEAGVILLRSLGVRGANEELAALVNNVGCHALSLTLVGAWLRDAYGGDVRKRDRLRIREVDAEEGGHAFAILDSYVRWLETEGIRGECALGLMRVLGLFDGPASAQSFAALLESPPIQHLTAPVLTVPEPQRNVVLARLQNARLLVSSRDEANTLSINAHPLVREFFATRLLAQHPEAWRSGHMVLFRYLSTETADLPQATLQDLQPLYQAVAHGCQAGVFNEACNVFRRRIVRDRQFYSSNTLGALGVDLAATAWFFDEPWGRVTGDLLKENQAWLLAFAAFNLRGLGRLAEAVEPMRAGLEIRLDLSDWENAASGAGNLSQLRLTLGDAAGARRDSRAATRYADRSGDMFERIVRRAGYAYILHQMGKGRQAGAIFRQAELLQAAWQPACPLLHSVAGFQYCEFLLDAPERRCWATALDGEPARRTDKLAETCMMVRKRAAETLEWLEVRPDASLLDVSLTNLTLARADLYRAVLSIGKEDSVPDPYCIDLAMEGLRHSGSQHNLPRGLLTRALYSFLYGEGFTQARDNLDEAWEIAHRSGMKLHQADVCLLRARLFGRRQLRSGARPYPWASPEADVIAARNLISAHSYARREEALQVIAAVIS